MIVAARGRSPLAVGVGIFTLFCFITTYYRTYISRNVSPATLPPDLLGHHDYDSLLAEVDESLNYAPIKNSTLGFEYIYSLSLAMRTDRRDGMALVSSASNILVDFVDGVPGKSIHDKALPPHWDRESQADNALGCWRGHMNIYRDIIQNRFTSALIIEDDASWDVSIKRQLTAFAKGSRYVGNQAEHIIPHSPYGDNWDLLWLGHCSSRVSTKDPRKFVMEKGPAVPFPNRRINFDVVPDMSDYDNNTRIVYATEGGVCTYAYAVSFNGAQKLLRGLSDVKSAIDLELREMCLSKGLKCVGVFPQLFGEYKPSGPTAKDSDISLFDGDFRERGYAYNIVFDARLNVDKLLNGDTNYESQWPEDLGEYDEVEDPNPA